MKKGFTLIELLAVIVILAIIALIVTPIVSNIVNNARTSANARSVEGHIRNIELAIISNAFASGRGDTDTYDNVTSGSELEELLSLPDNDNVTCETYNISHGTVLSATNCRANDNSWSKAYNYTNANGAVVASGSNGGNEVVANTWDTYKTYVHTCELDEDEYEVCTLTYLETSTFDDSWTTWLQEKNSGEVEVCGYINNDSNFTEPICLDRSYMYPSDYDFETGGSTNESVAAKMEGIEEDFSEYFDFWNTCIVDGGENMACGGNTIGYNFYYEITNLMRFYTIYNDNTYSSFKCEITYDGAECSIHDW